MTISISWRRRFGDVDEILFASDSRLSAGYRWDCAQKVFPIDGPNFAVSFSGNSDFALPCIFHLQQAVKTYGRYSTGAARIGEILGDFLRIVNQLREIVDDQSIAQFDKTNFLFSGYDHFTGEPVQKRISFNKSLNKFWRYPFNGFRAGGVGFRIGFVGDLWEDYSSTLAEVVSENGTELDYQPLEALWKVISRQKRDSHVGGMPQILKVYKSRNYLPYAVKRNEASSDIYLYGRPLLPYQISYYPMCHLDRIGMDGFVHYPINSPKREISPPPKVS
ncbi:hypothetical protein [Leisingera sp. ANG-S5]|uniref:hypothetical protein n=1 Tax=Leisingera sp. ANG-S5 TaxID=1577901 RepID=UPI00126A0E3C|nr:hypothetical protein [Leisingera sp. ANG-S5]